MRIPAATLLQFLRPLSSQRRIKRKSLFQEVRRSSSPQGIPLTTLKAPLTPFLLGRKLLQVTIFYQTSKYRSRSALSPVSSGSLLRGFRRTTAIAFHQFFQFDQTKNQQPKHSNLSLISHFNPLDSPRSR